MKLLIIDDHPVVREGLAALLQQDGSDIIILEAHDAAEGLALAEQHLDLDVVLLDLALPGMGGFPAISELGRRRPGLPVVVLSSSEDPRDVWSALRLGARGYVAKSTSRRTLLDALQFVLKGHVYVPPFAVLAGSAVSDREDSRAPEAAARLTERQLDVLRLLAEGVSNKEIAQRLDLAEKTVKVHVTGIFRALDVVNRTQAATVARELNLI
jgi:DNA-binding NarL/FixJ family response regulator